MSAAEIEPVPGLPESLPAGETLLWQGSPAWLPLAKTAFRLKEISIYFGALMLWRAGSALFHGESASVALRSALWVLPLMVLALAILSLLAFLAAKTTIYSVTDRRVVMRFGTALPLTVNVPFAAIDGAAVGMRADGTGDVVLTLGQRMGLGYLLLWPHVRPWRYANPEPMLRALPDAKHVAGLLRENLCRYHQITQSDAPKAVIESGQKTAQRPNPGLGGQRPAMAG